MAGHSLSDKDATQIALDLERSVTLITSLHGSVHAMLSRVGEDGDTSAEREILQACLEKAGGLVDRARGRFIGGTPDLVDNMDAWANLGHPFAEDDELPVEQRDHHA